eukprot:jgi/Tetstr1/434045/TSEL_023189.t1
MGNCCDKPSPDPPPQRFAGGPSMQAPAPWPSSWQQPTVSNPYAGGGGAVPIGGGPVPWPSDWPQPKPPGAGPMGRVDTSPARPDVAYYTGSPELYASPGSRSANGAPRHAPPQSVAPRGQPPPYTQSPPPRAQALPYTQSPPPRAAVPPKATGSKAPASMAPVTYRLQSFESSMEEAKAQQEAAAAVAAKAAKSAEAHKEAMGKMDEMLAKQKPRDTPSGKAEKAKVTAARSASAQANDAADRHSAAMARMLELMRAEAAAGQAGGDEAATAAVGKARADAAVAVAATAEEASREQAEAIAAMRELMGMGPEETVVEGAAEGQAGQSVQAAEASLEGSAKSVAAEVSGASGKGTQAVATASSALAAANEASVRRAEASLAVEELLADLARSMKAGPSQAAETEAAAVAPALELVDVEEVQLIEAQAAALAAAAATGSGEDDDIAMASTDEMEPYMDMEWEEVEALISAPGAEVIGKGAFGKVFRTTRNGAPVAVKVLLTDMPQEEKEMQLRTFEIEARILARLSSRKVIRLHGACLTEPNYAMVLEYIGGPTLDHLIHKESAELSYRRILQLGLEISQALEDLHPSIIHRDIKPANVMLVEGSKEAKLIDFGISHDLENPHLVPVDKAGSAPYMAPELFNGQNTLKADVYALGCVLLEMISREHIFKELKHYAQVVVAVAFMDKRPAIPDHCPPGLRRVIEWCFKSDPDSRPTAAELSEALRYLQQQDEMAYEEEALDSILNRDAREHPEGRGNIRVMQTIWAMRMLNCIVKMQKSFRRRRDERAALAALVPLDLPYPELQVMVSGKQLLGKGASGSSVYKAKRGPDMVAVKVLDQLPAEEELAPQLAQYEVEARVLVRLTTAQNVVRLFGASLQQPTERGLMMEYLGGGSAQSLISKSKSGLKYARAIELAIQAARGLAELHPAGVVHRDLRPANLLLDNAGKGKLINFGLAIDLSQRNLVPVAMNGDSHYMAPEQFQNQNSIKGDIYAFGCMLLEIVTGEMPFKELVHHAQLVVAVAFFNKRPAIPAKCPLGLRLIIEWCFKMDPEARPAATDLVEALEYLAARKEKAVEEEELVAILRRQDERAVKRSVMILQTLWASRMLNLIAKMQRSFRKRRDARLAVASAYGI